MAQGTMNWATSPGFQASMKKHQAEVAAKGGYWKWFEAEHKLPRPSSEFLNLSGIRKVLKAAGVKFGSRDAAKLCVEMKNAINSYAVEAKDKSLTVRQNLKEKFYLSDAKLEQYVNENKQKDMKKIEVEMESRRKADLRIAKAEARLAEQKRKLEERQKKLETKRNQPIA